MNRISPANIIDRPSSRNPRLSPSDGTQGQAHGVTEDGTLLVHTARGMQAITSAEISVRPSAAARPA